MTEVEGSESGTVRVWLRRNAQHRVAGLVLGIHALAPAGQAPAVLLGVRDEASGELQEVMLDVGWEAVVAGRRLRVEEIRPAELAAVHLSVLETEAMDDGDSRDTGEGHDPNAGVSRPVVGLAVVVASLVALALVVNGVAWTVWQVRMHRDPPAMTAAAAAAGATRLTYGNRHLPSLPTTVHGRTGGEASLALYDVFTRDHVATARLAIGPPEQDTLIIREIPAGHSVTVGGVTVRVVAAYEMPNPAHDAADVLVSAQP